jgi:hypothetical protein
MSRLDFSVDPEVAADGRPFVNLHVFRGTLSFMATLDCARLVTVADALEAELLQNLGWVRLRLPDAQMVVEAVLTLAEAADLAKQLRQGLQAAIREAARLAPLRAVGGHA